MEPLKELVVNALVHSSYRNHGTPIKVAFEDEKIWIESPGGLVPGMTVEKMTRGESSLRNPVLARVFKETGVVEAWGTGIPAVLQALTDAGLPEAEFDESVERLRITIHIPNHDPRFFVPAWQHGAQEPDLGPSGVEVSKSGVEVPGGSEVPGLGVEVLGVEVSKLGVEVSEGGVEVPGLGVEVSEEGVEVPKSAVPLLRAAGQGPVRSADLLDAAGVSQSPTNFVRRILPLVEAGLLARTIPDKPRSSKQRYTLTDEGRAVLAQMDEGSA
ncbi:MAG: hypothetical protein FWE61_00815 [Micrococcales bacterium]|nr:hypothetical protein [Micrococcales bacterium]